MCGIVGVLNLDGAPAAEETVRAMAARIRHRGPDGEGAFVDGPLGLGHRRLAILDLTTASHQPMHSADGRFVIAYNGEVYNFSDLRHDLEARGHRFRSRGDTEVVLNALAEWGTDALPRFDGMFAFALWDRETRTLTLARDRYGIKPLYTALCGQSVLFASEIKAFYAHPAFRAAIDTEGVREYFTFQNFFTRRTLFSGVEILPAGTTFSVSADDDVLGKPRRYWDFAFTEPGAPESEDRLIEQVASGFETGVRRQLVSDVPVSAYLSGGVDSGSVTAVAAAETPDLKTFTVGFDLSSASGMELAFDERAKAEQLSHLHKTEHYEMVLKAGDMERCLPRLMWHLEEPRVGQSYPNFYAAQLAGKFGKVVLSGAGGDELFGGYPWRYYRAAVNDNFDDYVDKYYAYWQRLIPDFAVDGLFRPIASSTLDTREIFHDVFASPAAGLTRPEDYINHSLYFEAKTFLHGLLVMEDKLSMAHGLETRVPFLDNALVDTAMAVPVRQKLGNLSEVIRLNENEAGDKVSKYFHRTQDGKLILRKVMRRFVPEEVSEREKQGFSAPDASWFKGESIDYVRRRLYGRGTRLYDFLDRRAVQDLVDEHLNGATNRRLLIWSLLCFEQWLEIFLEGNGLEPVAT